MQQSPKQRILNICSELGEDMDSPNCRALHEYIKTCPNCAAFVDSVKKTITLYRDYRPEYSQEKHTRLFKALKFD
jgi:hypothetical protein